MKKTVPFIITLAMSLAPAAFATQADDNDFVIGAQEAGASPFIKKVDITVTDPAAIRSIGFKIDPKEGSVTRPVSATYLPNYLDRRQFFDQSTKTYKLPVWGLYQGRANNVTVKVLYNDLSSDELSVVIATEAFSDACNFDSPTVVKPRTNTTDLSFDFMLVAGDCSVNSPTILDTDGEIRWVGTANSRELSTTFYENGVYIAEGTQLLRIEMDGEVTVIGDYAAHGVVEIHHSIDVGRDGLVLEVDTLDYLETVNFEVHPYTGEIQQMWNFADIIGDAIRAAGEDPGDPNDRNSFIRKDPNPYQGDDGADWWHNNSTTYRSSDNTLIVSSRENMVVAVDYDTKEIKWILGDSTKRWYEFAGLREYALKAPGTPRPIGQHTVSITADNHLLLFDNGQQSLGHTPAGMQRNTSAARKYALDLEAGVATQTWSYSEPGVQSLFCSGVYEDAPQNYVITYSAVGGASRILAFTSTGQKVFEYRYVTPRGCDQAHRTIPIHLEETAFPHSNVHLANISSRAFVGSDDNAAIAGFIITGTSEKPVVIRGLGPSLQSNGEPVEGRLENPTLELYNSEGELIGSNDDYNDSPGLPVIQRENLEPSDEREAAMAPVLAPGAYTAVLRGAGNSTGVGLIEVYDVDMRNGSKLANISTRAFVGTDENVLIGGILLRGNKVNQILFRGIGPSMETAGVENALQDPVLQIFDQNGVVLASNDDWKNANNAAEIEQTGVPPTRDEESALLMRLVTGNYTAVLRGKDGGTGVGLVEAYQIGQ